MVNGFNQEDFIAGADLHSDPIVGIELQRFEDWWELNSMRDIVEFPGRVPFWPALYKERAKQFVEAYKAHNAKKKSFDTNPTKGFGPRKIMPFDIFGAGAATAGEQDWDATIDYAAGERAWIGGTGPDGATFQNDTFIEGQGATDNNEIWWVFIMGFQDLSQSPRVNGFLIDLHNDLQAYHEAEYDFEQSEQQVTWLPKPILLTDISPVKIGVQLPIAARARLRPIGFTVLDSRRARTQDLSGMERPNITT